MFQILKKRGLIAQFSRPISKEELHLCGFAFVDDSDIIATSNNVNNPEHTVKIMQETLDAWEASAKVTGGTLEPTKSFGYLIHFNWNRGTWSYGKVTKEHTFTALDKDAQRVELTMKQPHEALKMLGVFLAPDGNNDAQYKYMYKKAMQLGEYMRNGFVHPDESFLALTTIAQKVIEYPLPALNLSESQLTSIMWQLLQHYLPKSGINRYINRTVLYAPKMYQGLGIKNPFILQGCKHVNDLCEHLYTDSITGKFMNTALEYLRLELGHNGPIFSLDPQDFVNYQLTDSWIKATWDFCYYHNIQFQDNTLDLPLRRENDVCLMEAFGKNKNLQKKNLSILNKCRLFLKAFTLSDIVTGDGTSIQRSAWAGEFVANTTRDPSAWPCIPHLLSSELNIWREALRTTFCTRRTNKLDAPLGAWTTNNGHHTWYLHSTTKQLFQKLDGQWQVYQPLSIRTRNFRYANKPSLTTTPQLEVLNPTTIFYDASRIIAEGCSATQFHLQQRSSQLQCPSWLFESREETGTMTAIKQDILDGKAIVVSDGSYDPDTGRGASSSIITNESTCDTIQVTSIVPGDTSIQSAYRSEVTGILASLQLLWELCQTYDIKQGTCTVVCDGKGALDKIFAASPQTVKPTWKQADLISACVKLIDMIPIQLIPLHVKGHQDAIRDYRDLSVYEQLNVIMDAKAKIALKNIKYSVEEVSQFPNHPLAYRPVMHKGNIITCNFTHNLYNSIYKEAICNYWTRHDRFPKKHTNNILWEQQNTAASETTPAQQRFISKWSSNYIGTGQNLVEWQLRKHGNCPFCNHASETTEHVLQCQHMEAQAVWQKALKKYSKGLKRIKTSPILITIILKELHCWRLHQEPPDRSNLPLKLRMLIHTQASIGWKNFLEGILTTQWVQEQQSSKQKSYTVLAAKAWAKNLIKLNWDLLQEIWQERNEKLHETQTILDREGHKELMEAIKRERAIGLNRLPIREFAYLFQIKWDKLKTRTTGYLKAWFVKVRLGRELYKDPRLIQDEFSDKGPLRTWAGLENKKRNEKELEKSIKREKRMGIGILPQQYTYLFDITDIDTEVHSLDKKKEWLKTVRQGREASQDPDAIIDVFSVQGPLRKWIGLAN